MRYDKQFLALEKNILKYRALEMILILFYVESLKSFILDTIMETDRLHSLLSQKNKSTLCENTVRISSDTKNKVKIALNILVKDCILTSVEYEEIINLIDYKNIISHEIYQLTGDISKISEKSIYDHEVKNRIKFYWEELPKRIRSRYVTPIPFDFLLFESAEKTYESELKTLNKRIRKQFIARRNGLHILKEASLNIDKESDNHPLNPENKHRNGRLTTHGITICHLLFDSGKSAAVVSYLMDISYKSALSHFKKWKMIQST